MIPEDWEVKTLEESVEKIIDHRGLTPLKLGGRWSKAGVRAISARNVKDGRLIAEGSINYVDEKLYRKWMPDEVKVNDILLTSEGPLGECLIWKSPEKIVLSQRIFGVRANSGTLNPEFLFWFMKSRAFQNELSYRETGTTVQGIRQSELRRTKIVVPPLSEQKTIARILSDLDSKIELNQLMNKTLEAVVKAIYKHWFIDFEFPNEEGKPYKSSGEEVVHDDELEREIPKAWSVVRLPDVALVIDCLHTKKPVQSQSDFVLLQVYNIDVEEATIDLTDKYTVSNYDYSIWTKNVEVHEGDCIITNAGIVGAVAQIPPGLKCGIGRNITAIRPKDIPPTYLLLYLRSRYGQSEIVKNTDQGTIFNSLNVKGIKRISVLMPPKEILTRFESICRPLRERIERNSFEDSSLKETRNLLLPKLMSGKIRVPAEVR